MTHKFEAGDLVRHKKTGREGILIEINPNPDYRSDDETWAEIKDPADDSHYLGDVDSPDDLELVTKKADIPEKRLPTMEELRDYLSNALHSGWDGGIRPIETGPEGEDAVEFYGQFDNQRFTAYIKIEDITWAD